MTPSTPDHPASRGDAASRRRHRDRSHAARRGPDRHHRPPPHPGGKAATTGSFVDSTPVPGGFASWSELLRLQQRMNTAAAQITNAAQRSANSGFAGIVADPTTRQLQVYWKGEPPANLVATARATVATQVLPAAYSQRELDRRGRAAAGRGRQQDHHGRAARRRRRPARRHAGRSARRDGSRRRTGDRADRGRRRARHPMGRHGAVVGWRRVAQHRHRRRLLDRLRGLPGRGDARMLSAAHCANLNVLATDPTGQTIGIVGTRNTGTDTLLLAGSSGGRVFNNSTDAAGEVVSEFSNQVIGALGQPGRQLRVHLRRVLRHPLLDPGEGPQPLHQRPQLRPRSAVRCRPRTPPAPTPSARVTAAARWRS